MSLKKTILNSLNLKSKLSNIALREMKEYLVEFEHPKTNVTMVTRIVAETKTEARDIFFEKNPNINQVLRITWVPRKQK